MNKEVYLNEENDYLDHGAGDGPVSYQLCGCRRSCHPASVDVGRRAAAAMRAMADEYEASHPNVTIEISCQADVSGLKPADSGDHRTSDAPEIFFMNYNLAAEYIPLGIVADLTPYGIDSVRPGLRHR